MFSSPYGTPRAKRRAAVGTSSHLNPGAHHTGPVRRSPSIPPSHASTHGRLPATPSVASRPRYQASEKERSPTIQTHSEWDGGHDEVGYIMESAVRAGTRRGTVFVRDERSTVSSFGELPEDAQRDLAGDEDHLYVHAVRAELDEMSGFAVLVTINACYVWNYVKYTSTTPTCYIFPYIHFLQEHRNQSEVPFARLVPHAVNSTREPGLLLVFPSGKIWYWDSVSIALTFRVPHQAGRFGAGGSVKSGGSMLGGTAGGWGMGPVKGVEKVLSLEADENVMDEVADVWVTEPGTFVITTAHARLHLLSILSSSGIPYLHLTPFTLPRGTNFFRSAPTKVFAGSLSSQDQSWGIRTVCEERNDRAVWVGNGKLLQRWTLQNGVPKFSSEHVLESSILDNDSGANFDDLQQILIISIASLPDGNLAVLFSYASAESNSEDGSDLLSYAISVFAFQEDDSANGGVAARLLLTNLHRLPYRSHADLRHVQSPRLIVPGGGQIAFALFSEAIAAVSLQGDVAYDHVITLKDPHHNVFVGSERGTPGHHVDHRHAGHIARLLSITSTSGLVGFEVDWTKLSGQTFASKSQAQNAQLKSKIEEAVFFGANEENPLSFELHVGFQGSLQYAAEEVSKAVVASTSPYSKVSADIGSTLADRALRLRALIAYIRDNGLLKNLDQPCLRRLSSHAEIVAAAQGLWEYQNDDRRMSQAGLRMPVSLLADAIDGYMTSAGADKGTDAIRTFFTYHIFEIETVLAGVHDILRSQYERSNDLSALSEWQSEANTIHQIAYDSALLTTHELNVDLYGLTRDKLAVTEVWLTSEAAVSRLEFVYNQTLRLLRGRANKYGSAIDTVAVDTLASPEQKLQMNLKAQLCDLVKPLCFAMEEHIRHMAYRLEHGLDGKDDSLVKLKQTERYTAAIGDAIRPLVHIQTDLAYGMAEHHHQYSVLVEFATDPVVGGNDKVYKYIAQYGEPFSSTLYAHYANRGEFFNLLDQPSEFKQHLTSFFEKAGLPRLSWVHLLDMREYAETAATLRVVAAEEKQAAPKHLILSLSKLSNVVALTQASSQPTGPAIDMLPDLQETLSTCDAGLEVLKLAEQLKQRIGAAADVLPGDNADVLRSKLRQFTSAKCHVLEQDRPRPFMLSVYVNSAGQLVTGVALGCEELSELYSLKDNFGEEVDDYIQGFYCFLLDQELSVARKQSWLVALWRRVYLRDDWRTLSNTSNASDAQIKARLDASAAHHVVSRLRSGKIGNYFFPSQYILPPSRVLAQPDKDQLAERFPEGIEQVQQEHAEDVALLRSYIEETDIERYVGSIINA